MVRKLCLTIICLFLTAGLILEAHSKEIEEPSLEEHLLIKAKSGDGRAQVELADLYRDGYKDEPNYSNAAYWYEKAAAQGNPYAQVELGILYWNGYGVKEDDVKAFELMEQAANQGFARGYGCLGLAYQKGYGVKKDYERAAKWYGMGADQDDTLSMIRLGRLYRMGLGVPKDGIKALRLFHLAAHQKNGPFYGMACYQLGYTYRFGLVGVEKDGKKALKWYQRAVDAGHLDAYVGLGRMYLLSEGVKKDTARAFDLFAAAAKKGDTAAMTNLAVMYSKGTGIAKDKEKAFYWNKKAADAGEKYAQYNTAFYYLKGLGGVQKNLKTAYTWYEKSAKQGVKDAQEKLNKLAKTWIFSIKIFYFQPNPVLPGSEGRIVVEYLPSSEGEPIDLEAAFSLEFNETEIVAPFTRTFRLSEDQTEQSILFPIPTEASAGIYKIKLQASSFLNKKSAQALFEIAETDH